jgi:hypothetical protein
MSLTKEQGQRIEEEAKKILLSRMDSFPDDASRIRNAPFHEAFLECFKDRLKPLNLELPYLIAIASWLHGLNTSLGTGFENIAHILSGGYKRSFTKSFVLKIKKSQAHSIEEIMRDLKSGRHVPDMSRENTLAFQFSKTDTEIPSLEFTADNYIETAVAIEAVELKSVRPNSGEGRGEKQKILYGKAAIKLANPKKNVKFFLGFPFDPTSDHPTQHNKERFFDYLIEFKKFFDPREVLLGSELWDHLSGSRNTMEEVLKIVKDTVKKVKT